MGNTIDRSALNALIGGVVGANLVGNDDSSFSTLLGVATGATVGAMGKFTYSQDVRDRINRLSTKDIVQTVDEEHINSTTKTAEDKLQEVLKKAREHAKHNTTSTSKTIDNENILETLNKDTIEEYERILRNNNNTPHLITQNIIFDHGQDKLRSLEGQVDPKLVIGKPSIRLNADAPIDVRNKALGNELVKLGYKRGSIEYKQKLQRLETLVQTPNVPINIGDGSIEVGNNLKVKIVKSMQGETGVDTLVHKGNGVVEDITRINPFAKQIIQDGINGYDAYSAVGQAMTPEVMKLYNVQALLKESSGLAPDEALAMTKGMKPEQQIKLLQKVQESFGTAYAYNAQATDEYRHNISSGNPNKPVTPSSHSGGISSTVEYGHTLNFEGENGYISQNRPISSLGTSSRKGVMLAENKKLIQKLFEQDGVENAFAKKGDWATRMPIKQVRIADPSTGKMKMKPNPYNNVFTPYADVGRNIGTTGNRAYKLQGDADLNRDVKELYNAYGGKNQYATSVALRAQTIDPELGVGNTKLSNILNKVFGSNTTTADGFGILSKDAARTMVREGYESSRLSGIGGVGANQYVILKQKHVDVLEGKISMKELENSAKQSSTMFSKASTQKLTKIKNIVDEVLQAKNNSNNTAEYVANLQQSKLLQPSTIKAISAPNLTEDQIHSILDKDVLGSIKKDNLFLRGTKSLSNQEHVATQTSWRKATQDSLRNTTFSDMGDLQHNLSHYLSKSAYDEEHVLARDAYFLTPGQILGYGEDGGKIKVPELSTHYTLSGMSINRSYDYQGQPGLSDVMFNFKSKLDIAETKFHKLYGVSSKALVSVEDHDSVMKTLLLNHFAEEGRLDFNEQKGLLHFKLKNDKYKNEHKILTEKLNKADLSASPNLKKLLTTGKVEVSRIADMLAESDKLGIRKDVSVLTKRAEAINSKRIKEGKSTVKNVSALEPKFKQKTISIDAFRRGDIPTMFGETQYSMQKTTTKVVNKSKIPKPTSAEFTDNLVEGLKPLLGEDISNNMSPHLKSVLNSVLNTTADKIKLNKGETRQQAISRTIGQKLQYAMGRKGTWGAKIGRTVGDFIGDAIGKTYTDLQLPKGSGKTIGLELEQAHGDKLGSVFADNLVVASNNKNISVDLGTALGKTVNETGDGSPKQAAQQIKKSFKTITNILYVPNQTVNSEVQGIIESTKNVGLILDADSTGANTHKKLTQLFEDYGSTTFEKDLEAQIPNTALRQTISNKLKVDKSPDTRKGLASFVMSFANKEKTAQEHLITAMHDTNSTFKDLLKTHLADTSNKENLIALDTFMQGMTGTSVVDNKGKAIKNIEQVANKAIKTKLDSVHSHYSSDRGIAERVYDLSQSPDKRDDLADFFINSKKHASKGEGNIVEVAAANRGKAEADLGGTRKSMSWLVSKQLRDNGFTEDELNLFGKISSHDVADYEAVSMLTSHKTDTINSKLTDSVSRDKFKLALAHSPNERREALKAIGMEQKGLVGAYKIQTPLTSGFENVPIIMEDSRLFGNYLLDSEEKTKKVPRIFERLINLDMSYTEAKSDTERKGYMTKMDDLVEEAKRLLLPHLGGSDNLGKKLLTREASNATYSRAVPVYGALEDYANATKNPAVASISIEGIRHRLSKVNKDFLGGVDITKLKDSELLQQDFIRPTGHDGLYDVVLSHEGKEMPMYTVMSREPSAGPGSATVTKMMLDTNSKVGKEEVQVVANSSFNRLYKFLDFDDDKVIETAPHLTKDNFKTAHEAYNKGQVFNKRLDDLSDFTELLGVKGKKKGVTTFLDVADRSHVTDSKSFVNAFMEDLVVEHEKLPTRKIQSPQVTKVSQQISEHVAKTMSDSVMTAMSKGMSGEVGLRSRVIAHYLTENLIKSMHQSNEEYRKKSVTVAEELNEHLSQNNMKAFNTVLGNYAEDQIIKGKKVQEIVDIPTREKHIKDIRDAVSHIQEAMLGRVKGESIATPVDLQARTDTKYFDKAVEDLQQLVHNPTNTTIPLVTELEEGVVPTVKRGYHTASELLKENYKNNKKLLLGAGAFVGATALLTQHKPDFGDNKAHANTNGMLLESGRTALEETASELETRNSNHPATEYLHKFGSGPKQMTASVDQYSESYGDQYQDVSGALLGNNLSSIRVLSN